MDGQLGRQRLELDGQNVKGATEGDGLIGQKGKDGQMWGINHLSFSAQNRHKHTCTHTQEGIDPLALSSFSCDVIEAEQQTLKA